MLSVRRVAGPLRPFVIKKKAPSVLHAPRKTKGSEKGKATVAAVPGATTRVTQAEKSKFAQLAVPLLCTSATVGVSLGAGDALCQVVQYGEVEHVERTRMMAGIGAFITGPISHAWNMLLERFMPGSTALRILQKTVANSCYGFFVSLPLMFSAVTLLSKGPDGERKTLRHALSKIQADLVPTFLTGVMYWPVCNVFIFRFVPLQTRAIANGLAGTLWNIYLCLVANRDIAEEVDEVLEASDSTATHE